MTPGARAQAAIELLDEIIAAARAGGAAADTLIARYFKTRRYAGSKDRRAIRDLVYRAIRRAGDPPADGRAALVGLAREDDALAAAFDGSPHTPAPIVPDEPGTPPGVLPGWLAERIDPAEHAALLERASLDVRVNRSRADRDAVAAMLADAVPTRFAPQGLRLPEGTPVEAGDAWTQGLIEIQDQGSQLIALAAQARPEMTVLDLCAGAGGKTLALADDMGGQGRLIASDSNRARLSRLSPRAERSGFGAIETRLLDPGREAEALADLREGCDVVLIDAPCSGTGTWRRNPEARWRLTPARLAQLTGLQAHLLDIAAPLVKPGGALVYAVCSLLDEEGADQLAALLGRNDRFHAADLPFRAGRARGAGRLLSPKYDGTDGFFVARLVRA
ncbi:RsmB/NOP family class I SAM-dependent RNA methyltransferase [Rhizorhabdus dicambivorans]|uniref:RNA methyltransferase n=1 Tax=Rhizorhabdus dicambivorans TaxID=1850238 RepID=A0A2A4FXC2_9SPHN|nr:RsmB/NOP family class I SAM-dependent RNA methyltransferase [Rhizorhabdus dicambivorans]ATE65332.1 RNA methyltransferase [Rhizorhabdus dicambivorans]PCE42339.1 RNA methyltransferase [Rhizorhabdus dicambivorans]